MFGFFRSVSRFFFIRLVGSSKYRDIVSSHPPQRRLVWHRLRRLDFRIHHR